MKIATFNINGVNKRLANLLAWLDEARPDVVCLQELKAEHDAFPAQALERAGYGAAWKDERTWNGVAILVRGGEPVVTRTALPGDPSDSQARYLEAAVDGVLIASLYLPNGNPQPGPKFDYKLAWFERLIAHAETLIATGAPAVLAGDYNVVPTDADIYNPRSWKTDALLQPEPRALYRRLLAQGWMDALHAFHSEPIYTFWAYLREAWPRNAGLRIDHLLVSPALIGSLADASVDAWVRGAQNASDHAPAWLEID